MSSGKQRYIARMYYEYTGEIADMETMMRWYARIFYEVYGEVLPYSSGLIPCHTNV